MDKIAFAAKIFLDTKQAAQVQGRTNIDKIAFAAWVIIFAHLNMNIIVNA